MENTLTEEAFDKARRYDAIIGFFIENFRSGCNPIPFHCPRNILDRYQLHLGDIDTSLISFLNDIAEENKKPKLSDKFRDELNRL